MSKSAAAKKSKNSAGESLSFESALHRLEAIVTQLEQADAPLEQALTLYEEGVRLASFCSKQLKSAERRVEILEDKNGILHARPFADEEESGEEDLKETDSGNLDEEEEEKDEDGGTPSPPRGGHSQNTLF